MPPSSGSRALPPRPWLRLSLRPWSHSRSPCAPRPQTCRTPNLRCLTYGNGATYVQARHGHPALRELRDAGYPVATYHTQAGTGIDNRPQILLIPIADWDALAAQQRGQGPRPTGVLPTPADRWEDKVSMLYEDAP